MNIKGCDDYFDYEATKNIVLSSDEEGLEDIEQWCFKVLPKLGADEIPLIEHISRIKTYTSMRLDEILYTLYSQ